MPDIKAFYGTPADVVITLASLASDANLLAGQQSNEIDNTIVRAVDYTIGGKIAAGANATAGVIEMWVVASWDNVGLYPDVITAAGTAAKTFSSLNIKNASARSVGSQVVAASASSITYPFAPVSVAGLFGMQLCPPRFVVFVTHSSGVALNSSAATHQIRIQPEYETVG